ncbi:UDP-galactose transporter 2 [Tetrabaena socialis]|uniref:UDP-galactose transporter 2 n=1 Tax=Tetrabaena socialis TaxID=47790 RepID=A0A2J7ZYD0_9CHLO|nr:UDP-galactose transporter 2 [Tetrabaena socialis]|eukprot:PNH05272.1 UDP-galactose transporter 2 [Tetrabaena socialis]
MTAASPTPDQAPSDTRLYSISAWLLNVTTCVAIVFVNKALMDPWLGAGFKYATSLSSLHYLVCGACIWGLYGVPDKLPLPWDDLLKFTLIASASISSLNISLLLNSIAKLTCVPCVCMLEALWFGKTFSLPLIAAMATVVAGAGIVSITDVSVTPLGFAIAAVSVVTSSAQQILCGSLQKKHQLSSIQFLSAAAPAQGLVLGLVCAFVDKLVSGSWVWAYRFSTTATMLLSASCAVAVLVNVSQFMCLGRFSAATFQVMGHAKTISVLVIGWLFLGDEIGPRKLLGMCVAVTGMVMGHAKTISVLVIGWLFLGDEIGPRKLLGMCVAVTGMVAYTTLNLREMNAAAAAAAVAAFNKPLLLPTAEGGAEAPLPDGPGKAERQPRGDAAA